MKIDSFIFCDELDLLEIRLQLLYDVVDRFVLVEADRRHTGEEKPYFFAENRQRYSPWLDKITDMQIVMPWKTPPHAQVLNDWQYGRLEEGWGVDRLSEALITVSDADEIPDPAQYDQLEPGMCFAMNWALFRLGLQAERPWHGCMAVRDYNWFADFKIRNEPYSRLRSIPGGWHLQWMGGIDSVLAKRRGMWDALHPGMTVNYGVGVHVVDVTAERYPAPILEKAECLASI